MEEAINEKVKRDRDITLADFLGKKMPEDYNRKIRCPICRFERARQKTEELKSCYRVYLHCPSCDKTLFTVTGTYRSDVISKFKEHYKHVERNGIAPAPKHRDF